MKPKYSTGQATPTVQKILWDAVFQEKVSGALEVVAYVEGEDLATLFAEAQNTKDKLDALLKSVGKIRQKCLGKGEWATADALKSLLDRP